MSDIFISYASVDRERAKVIAEALAARGLSVWWDRNIPPGRQFDEVIEEALDSARAVVVLWSQASTTSTWVKTEAAEALRAKVLIPAMIEEGVKIPLEFRRVQAADLSHWRGDANDPQLQQFFASVEDALGRAPTPGPVPKPLAPEPSPPRTPHVSPDRQPRTDKPSPALIGGIAAGVVLLAAAIYFGLAKNRETPQQQAAPTPPAPAPVPAPTPQAETVTKDVTPRPAPVAPPKQASAPAQPKPVPQSGQLKLKWRDHALGFTGVLQWAGGNAGIQASAVDLQTGTAVGNYAVPAYIQQQGPMDYVVSANFAVPGDSTTPGPHTHTSRLLVRAQQDGSLRFLQNCPRPGECY